MYFPVIDNLSVWQTCGGASKKRLKTADNYQVNQLMESNSVMPAAECVYCTMFLPDVVIPESPEAYVKLTEQTLNRSSTGRQQQTPA